MGPNHNANKVQTMKRHHILVGVIAIVVAIALAANYYLW
jgi:hypothetical protein